ncbi:MAG: alpha/beta hydrolase [Bacteroidia bacterium]|nr:alpha/beta hydrolase [Bacteroidia bacterium]
MNKEIIRIPLGRMNLEGELVVPEASQRLVIFSHGSGSSRFSPRNNFVAGLLQRGGISTFLPDLLTEEEDRNEDNRFDIDLLTERLVLLTRHVAEDARLKNFRTGYFGASTGAASALKASVEPGVHISAIVSRGGRPDLVPEVFSQVACPTLLIVGARDEEVLALNRIVYERLHCVKKLTVVAGATHLFEEAGCLEQAGHSATEWFKQYL